MRNWSNGRGGGFGESISSSAAGVFGRSRYAVECEGGARVPEAGQ
uniref:Uncharacterized protein n=1 Tax=Arundo donax TaxID=35708 RepID=A0A0A9AIE3_ARUDO